MEGSIWKIVLFDVGRCPLHLLREDGKPNALFGAPINNTVLAVPWLSDKANLPYCCTTFLRGGGYTLFPLLRSFVQLCLPGLYVLFAGAFSLAHKRGGNTIIHSIPSMAYPLQLLCSCPFSLFPYCATFAFIIILYSH